jgi:hypothetical protein
MFIRKYLYYSRGGSPLVRPLPIPHLHDWRKMKVCLINLNKCEDHEGVYNSAIF